MSESNDKSDGKKCLMWGPGKRVLTPCTFLANGIRGDNGNVVGLTQLMLGSGDSPVWEGPIVNKVDRSDSGMVLNFCPFCGERILSSYYMKKVPPEGVKMKEGGTR